MTQTGLEGKAVDVPQTVVGSATEEGVTVVSEGGGPVNSFTGCGFSDLQPLGFSSSLNKNIILDRWEKGRVKATKYVPWCW